jgi:stalled ribosome rescue protein Dom34
MKLIRKVLERDRSGGIVLCPEDPEDFWHVYHLIAEKDQLTARTYRYHLIISNEHKTMKKFHPQQTITQTRNQITTPLIHTSYTLLA